MGEKKKCPLCGRDFVGIPVIDRNDNHTLICEDCGTRQSLAALGIGEPDKVLERIHAYAKHKAAQEKEEQA